MARFKRGRGIKRKRGRFQRSRGRKFNKRVKRAIIKFAEKKYIDAFPLYDNIVATTPIVVPCGFNPAVGTAQGQRIGAEIFRRSLNLKATLFSDGDFTQWRIIVICWNDLLQGAPATSDILENTGLPLLSYWNRSNLKSKRFIPMYDRLISVNSNGSANTVKNLALKFTGKRLPRKRVVYNSAGNVDYGYYMFLMSDHIAASPVTARLVGRMTYTDV